MLEVAEIVDRCQTAIADPTPPLAVRDVVDELIRDPGALGAAIGPITEGGIKLLHRADDLTVLHIAWTRASCSIRTSTRCSRWWGCTAVRRTTPSTGARTTAWRPPAAGNSPAATSS